MKSWSNWEKLNECNVKALPECVKGVYVIRMAYPPKDAVSDIIYISAVLKTKV